MVVLCTCQSHATGDLTNRGVKFPTTGAKSAVKSPLCPHPSPKVGDLTTPQGLLSAYFMHATINLPSVATR